MRWTSSSLQDLIADLRARQGDTTDVEVKAAAGGAPSLAPTLCALGNMPEGGTIILGLDETTGFTPVGLTNISQLEQAVASQARTGVTPPVYVEFQTFRVDGKPVLVVDVQPLPLRDRPGRHGGQPYLRQSDGDYVMSQQEVAQIELLKTQAVRPTQPDRQPVAGSSAADLDPELLASYLTIVRATSRRYATATDDQVLQFTSVITKNGELTLAGLYAMGRVPQSTSPSLAITAAVQLPRSHGGPRTRDLAHMVGPIPDLLEEAMSWVARNTHTTMGYDDRGHGIDRTELPMRAVREIVANALVHRNLDPITDSKRVEIRLKGDRLVITSPGGLWGVSESQLGHPGAKSAVNPVLYDICKHVRLADGSRVIEGEGGGIREALDALQSAGLRRPEFVDTGVQFTVVLLRHTLISQVDLDWLSTVAGARDLSSEERAILASMRHGETWTNQRVRDTFAPMDSVAARQVLQRLADTGLTEAHGAGRGTYYTIAPGHTQPHETDLRVEEDPPDQPTRPTDSDAHARDPGRVATKHGPAVLAALTSPKSVKELQAATQLTEGQVRYALTNLIEAGEVIMDGAQGVRSTTYRRATDD